MPQFIRIFFNKFKEYIVLILLLIFSLILITVNDNSKVKNVRLMSLGVFAGITSFISNLASIFENTEYIEQLEKRNAELMLENNRLRTYGLENTELNNFLEFQKVSAYSLVTAKVVSKLVSKISGYMIISKGSNSGVHEGMPVITDKGLVGIVTNSASDYSSVRLFENSLFKVAVKVERSNVDGVLNWDGKNLLIKNVPTTEDVEVGDRVVISELSTILPPTIPIGIVIEKESTLSGILSNLVIQPFVDLGELRNVLVILVDSNNQIDSLSSSAFGRNK